MAFPMKDRPIIHTDVESDEKRRVMFGLKKLQVGIGNVQKSNSKTLSGTNSFVIEKFYCTIIKNENNQR